MHLSAGESLRIKFAQVMARLCQSIQEVIHKQQSADVKIGSMQYSVLPA